MEEKYYPYSSHFEKNESSCGRIVCGALIALEFSIRMGPFRNHKCVICSLCSRSDCNFKTNVVVILDLKTGVEIADPDSSSSWDDEGAFDWGVLDLWAGQCCRHLTERAVGH